MPRIHAYPAGRFCWIDLLSIDAEASATFYCGVFGWEHVPQHPSGGPSYGLLTLHGDAVAGVASMPDALRAEGVPTCWVHYVAVENVDRTLERVTAAGGRISVPAWDVEDYGRTAFFLDPEGAQLGVWQAGRHVGAARTHEPDTMCWNELATRDVRAAARFFGQVFDWKAVDNPIAPTDYLTLKQGEFDAGGLLQMNEQWGEMPSHWSVYFEVESADRSSERVRELGGTVHFGPFEAPVGRIAVCTDPHGANFYLIEISETLRKAR